MFQQIM